ncbi:uncharacterized protein LOC135715880 [Ochlerotatus camptorhynchus]|uniref:uncharacterized protein LOC135715880 n=1 Tax=Ochlerotatus camptorhynchus TaxID=644619 RepID=UPI0031D76DC2
MPVEMCPDKLKAIVEGLFPKHDQMTWPPTPYGEAEEDNTEAIVGKEKQACSSRSSFQKVKALSVEPPEKLVRPPQPMEPVINIRPDVTAPRDDFQSFLQPSATTTTIAQTSAEIARAVQIVQQSSTSNVVQEPILRMPEDFMLQQIQLKPLETTSSLPGEETDQVETATDLDALIKQNIFDSVNDAMRSYLDIHIENIVERAVTAAVDRSFATNFARLAAMTEVLNKTASKDDTVIELRSPVDTEKHVTDWNAELTNDALQMKYMEFFSRIIVPNSYVEKGDNAFYVIADCLFTRQFWNRFTWTGVNRGHKSKRGFREFGNVTELLLKLIQIGDPTYTKQQLEKFCKTRLFRHAKTRSANKMLRKSSCRTKRGVKRSKPHHEGAMNGTDDIELDDNGSDGEDMEDFENTGSIHQPNDTDTSEGNDGDFQATGNSDGSSE